MPQRLPNRVMAPFICVFSAGPQRVMLFHGPCVGIQLHLVGTSPRSSAGSHKHCRMNRDLRFRCYNVTMLPYSRQDVENFFRADVHNRSAMMHLDT